MRATELHIHTHIFSTNRWLSQCLSVCLSVSLPSDWTASRDYPCHEAPSSFSLLEKMMNFGSHHAHFSRIGFLDRWRCAFTSWAKSDPLRIAFSKFVRRTRTLYIDLFDYTGFLDMDSGVSFKIKITKQYIICIKSLDS